MEKPCVATRAYGMPEVVIEGKTGYCAPRRFRIGAG